MKISESKFRLSLLEIFLLELVCYLVIWLLNEYLATLLTFILTAIVFAVLVIAGISEMIEQSKVPRQYFYIMALSVVAPVLAALVYLFIFGGNIKW